MLTNFGDGANSAPRDDFLMVLASQVELDGPESEEEALDGAGREGFDMSAAQSRLHGQMLSVGDPACAWAERMAHVAMEERQNRRVGA